MANVRAEVVDGIINWHRGEETLELIQPRFTKMALVGLGAFDFGLVDVSSGGMVQPYAHLGSIICVLISRQIGRHGC